MVVPEIADYMEDVDPEQIAGIAEKIFSKSKGVACRNVLSEI